MQVCQDELVAARWPRGVECPTCGSRDVTYLANQKRWQCKAKHPQRQFSVKVGTIFEDSPISLSKWFTAIWLISSAKNGISSYELHRAIGVTQKTGWFMLHRIRLAMQARSFEKKFDGVVEADETFVGGKSRNMHLHKRTGRGNIGKVAVAALLQRHGRDGEGHSMVSAVVVPSTRRRVLQQHMRESIVMDGKTTVYSDALRSYEPKTPKGWRPSDLYIHKFIDHAETYVDGQIHTNGCENFWSLLKRGLRGTYISVEPFHLFRYVDEQVYRFNSRKMNDGDRFDEMTGRVTGRRVTYKELTGKTSEQNA